MALCLRVPWSKAKVGRIPPPLPSTTRSPGYSPRTWLAPPGGNCDGRAAAGPAPRAEVHTNPKHPLISPSTPPPPPHSQRG